MSKAIVFMPMFVAFLCAAASATIIDIPGDYATIQQGINASVDGDTVLVQPGTYAENIDFNSHNVVLGSLFLTTGDTEYISQTIIDGNSTGPGATFENGENNNAMITGFTIQNGLSAEGGGIYCMGSSPAIIHNFISGNNSPWFGGGIYCEAGSSPIIESNRIDGNSAAWGGGGLYIDDSQPSLSQNIISGNYTASFGGGILFINNGNARITNTVFSRNMAGFGGGICCTVSSYPVFVNCILWADSADMAGNEQYFDNSSLPDFSYCDLQDIYPPGEGNISVDPVFRDPDNGDFHLSSDSCGYIVDSPCIDAGDPNLLDHRMGCDWGIGYPPSDMGAYGGGDSVMVGIDDDESRFPREISFLQNYPNPFNLSTTIRMDIRIETDIRINIYDVLGRPVATLFEGERPAGSFEISWNADGLPSGVYFARLEVPCGSDVIRMVLLK